MGLQRAKLSIGVACMMFVAIALAAGPETVTLVPGLLGDRDRPGTPTGIEVTALGPTSVRLKFNNTAPEVYTFEIEQKTNGVRIPQLEEASLVYRVQRTKWANIFQAEFDGLTPESEYCYSLWSRKSSGVRSAQQSAWGCARTPPNRPLAPLDFKVQLHELPDERPAISWRAPDQSEHRSIARFVVERQTSPSSQSPWIVDADVPANGHSFNTKGSGIDRNVSHRYRVCAVNSVQARACSAEIAPAAPPRTLVAPANAPTAASHVEARTSAVASSAAIAGTASPSRAARSATVLQRREPVAIQGGPTQTRAASPRIAGVAPPTPAQTQAASIKTERLICRGGPALNVERFAIPADGGGVLMQINFVPARDARNMPVPAGRDAETLPAASCSFADRSMTYEDPVGVRFETQAPPSGETAVKRGQHESSGIGDAEQRADSRTIPAYMDLDNHYWQFDVYKTSYGYMHAVANSFYKRRADTSIQGDRDAPAMTIARLTNVAVHPEMGAVSMRFIARPDATPVIYFSTQPLSNNDLTSPPPRTFKMTASRDARSSNATSTTYVASSAAQKLPLLQNSEYDYLIDVPGVGSIPRQQARGTVRTLTKTTRVRFDKIKILSLSDDYEGFNLNLRINPSEVSAQYANVHGSDWQAGKRYEVGKEFTLEGDVQRLRLLVDGRHGSNLTSDCPERSSRGEALSSSRVDYYDKLDPYPSTCADRNVAKREYFLETDPQLSGSERTMPFVLVATLGRHRSQVTFEITGSISVKRPY